MEFLLGKGVGKEILEAIREARRRVIVVSPWISRRHAELLRKRRKSIDVKVYTTDEGNPGLEEFKVKGISKDLAFISLLTLIIAVLVALYSLKVSLFLIFLSLFIFFLSFRSKLPGWVKIVDGLHAKIYIVDDTVYLTSANLTYGGTHRNIEFVLKLPLERIFEERVEELEKIGGR